MVPNILPNWARLTLSIATAVSHLPQYHRIREQGTGDGLSSCYLFFGLISATEQLTVGFLLNVPGAGHPRSDVFVNNPATAGDWFNFAQLVVDWLCALLQFFFVYFRFSSAASPRPGFRRTASGVYVGFLCLSLVPAVIAVLTPGSYATWAHDIFTYAHYLVLLPASAVLTAVAGIPQVREICRRRDAGALSLPGLAVQAVVSALLAISWMIRVKYPPYLPSWDGWYRLVGWPVVGNALSAVVQVVLLWISLCRFEDDGVESFETRPLLLA